MYLEPMAIQEIHQELYNELLEQVEANPKLHFRPRKTNRAGKLEEKGWWFLGSDHSLSIGFWDDMNWKIKGPNIAFESNSQGKSYLVINCSDSQKKLAFVKNKLLPKLDLQTRFYGFARSYQNVGVVEALQIFLAEDWPVIDQEIRRNQFEYGDEAAFKLIDDWLFESDLKNLATYNRAHSDYIKNKRKREYFRLQEIEIFDYDEIQHCKIADLPESAQWIFVTGENGSGKTSLLRAMAIGLCQNYDDGRKLLNDDKFKINLILKKAGEKFEYQIDHSTAKSEDEFIPEGFATYGATRLIVDSDTWQDDLVKIDHKAITKRLTYGLFNSINVLKSLASPYDIMERNKYVEMSIQAMLEHMNDILDDTIVQYDEEYRLIFFDVTENEDTQKGKFFHELSSGTKSFCALIIDLYLTLKKQQPKINDFAEYKGIVLIDEIDLHLHPKKQKEIIIQLSRTFPALQFIVTTHSPIPLLGAPAGSVILRVSRDYLEGVKVERFDSIEQELPKLLPNTLLTSPIFGLVDIFPDSNTTDKISTEDDYIRMRINEHLRDKLGSYEGTELEEELFQYIKGAKK